MKDPRITKLAKTLLTYSVKIKTGERIMIEARGMYSLELVKELVRISTEMGAVPFWYYNDDSIERHFLRNMNETQMNLFTDFHRNIMEHMDAYIVIRGSENVFDKSDVPHDKMKLYNNVFFNNVVRYRIDKTKWCVLRFPNSAMAQLAETSQEAFEDFYFDVCNLDYTKLSKAMSPLKELMEATDKVHIKGPNTDLTFSIKDIPVVKCDGDKNIPDGEVYTAPVRDSVNGVITYNAPALYEGHVYEGISLEFENGKIVKATCNSHEEKLNKILDTDQGSRYIGEFSIGVNPFINKPMKDTLFDEKIYGSIHLTPGMCYDEAPNGNKSAIHWDLVLIQTPEYGGGEIYFDDVLIRKDGEFVHPELKSVLNADAFLSD